MSVEESLNLLARARLHLTIREQLATAAPWPDRPDGFREDFDELDLATIEQQIRDQVGDEVAARLIDGLNRDVVEAVHGMAARIVRRLLGGGK